MKTTCELAPLVAARPLHILDGARLAEVGRHLDTCASCRDLLRRAEDVLDATRFAPVALPS
ncbi:MAG: hypothetical protein ACAI25_05980, partial [Planctomycetota bacterium]